MMKRSTAFLVCLVLSLLSVREAQAGTWAIKAGALIDGRSDAVARNVTIIVRDDRIAAVGAGIEIPDDATLVDLGAYTVLPGFIDAHTHIMLDGLPDYYDDLYKISVPFRALRAAASVRTALMNGFTSMRDVGSEGAMYADVDVRKAVETGLIPGPRLWVSTRALSTTGRYIPSDVSWEVDLFLGCQIVDGANECIKAVREQVAQGTDWIKVYADWPFQLGADGEITGIPNFTPEEMSAIVSEAHRLGRRVAVHALTREGIKLALDAGAESIEHGWGFTDELLKQAKKQGVFWCPTLLARDHRIRYANGDSTIIRHVERYLDVHLEALNSGYEMGVKIALGTDVGSFPWSDNQAREFELYVTGAGMAPMDAIRAGTSVAADLLGASDLVGAVAPGMAADLVAVQGNPLEDISVLQDVQFVMKNGTVYRNDE